MARTTTKLQGSIVLLSLGAFAASAAAEEASTRAPQTLPPVVVEKERAGEAKRKKAAREEAAQAAASTAISPTLQPTPVFELGSSVTVITHREIEAQQHTAIPQVFATVPGLNVVQSGGPGGATSVFLRGTNSNHTKVLLDGMDINDPNSASGSYDFAHLSISDVDRIEVLRGPQSGLYGADAVGGVIDIRTKRGEGPARITGSVEGGSYGTFNQTGGVSGSSGAFSYLFNAAHLHTGDMPVTPLELLPPGQVRNNDSYDNQTYTGSLGVEIAKNFDVSVTTRHVASNYRFSSDAFNFSTFLYAPEPTQSESVTKQWFTRALAHHTLFDGAFEQTFGVGYMDYRRKDFDPDPAAGTSTYNGDRLKYDWTGVFKLIQGQTLTLGAERQTDEIVNSPLSPVSTPVSAAFTDTAGFAQVQSSFQERFFNVASVRYDSNDRFGDVTTYRVAPAFLILETDTKLKGSYGTGFKAPSLNEMFVNYPAYDLYANPNLKPEVSSGYDLGFEQWALGRRLQFGATYFHNDITNLITLGHVPGSPDPFAYWATNVNQAAIDGVETFVAFKPRSDVSVRVDYTYIMAMDAIAHTELLRRPKHKVSVQAKWQATEKLNLSATVIHAGDAMDYLRDSAIYTPVKWPGYTVVNVAADYDVGGGVTVFSRIDNLFDEHYQAPSGWLRPGIGAYAGLKISVEAAELADRGR
jgi:vitamin B12 transporter